MLIISGEKNLISVNSGSLPTLKSSCGTTMPRVRLCWHHISLLEPMETSSFSNVLPLWIHAELCSARLVLPHRLHRLALCQKGESEVAQSCPTLCDPMECSLPGSFVHGIFQGKSTGVGCHFLLQGIFLTQGSNSGLPHCKKTLPI